MKQFALLITTIVSCSNFGHTQAGQLDASFGKNGIVTADFGLSTSAGWAYGKQVLTQKDGSIYLIVSDGSSSSITRLHANGTVDSSYGYNGNSKFIHFQVAHGAFQSDGKIVVVGYTGNYPDYDNFSLGRYNANGSVDTTFSGDGILTTDFGPGKDVASSVAIQRDGKIVAAGTSSGDFALARYNTNGTLDATFSGDGNLTVDFASGDDRASSVAVQEDGKIVVIGITSKGSKSDFALARYNTNGSLDKTFSKDGKQTTNFNTYDIAYSIAIQRDGKIVLAGGTGEDYRSLTLARYNTDGSLDKSFSADGILVPDPALPWATSVAIQTDGKIVAVGGSDFSVARFNSDGTPDSTFSEDGRLSEDVGSGGAYPNSVSIRSDNSIVVAGTVYNDIPYFKVTCYNADGTLNTTFSKDGKLEDFVHVSDTYYTNVAIQSDGKIVAAGNSPSGIFTGYGWASQGALARYNTGGSLDKSFSKQTPDFTISSIAVQKNGKIVVAGTYDDGYGDFNSSVARYNTDGTLDNTFEIFNQTSIIFASIAIQRDGKIVVAGRYGSFIVARLNADGTPDSTFSADSNQNTNFDCQSIAIQNDGKIVLAGSGGVYPNSDFVLARYNTNGTLDKTFSEDGKQTTDFGSYHDIAKAVSIQTDGKIVVIGNTGDTSYFALARYNIDGTLDTTFSEDGKQTSFAGTANTVVVQSDGKIVVGGSNDHFLLARFNKNGSLDNTFGKGGKQVDEESEGGINDIAIAGNKLYAVGYHQNPGRVGAVARYLLDGVSENKPPTVSLSIPYNIVKYSAPARIKLNATATDEDGEITKVRFYNGTMLVHTEDVYPYGFLWNSVPVGNYRLTAKAYDNSGNVTTSNAINVAVVEENVPPVVSILNPGDDTTYTGPATIRLIAQAHDPNDRISKVEFYSGKTLLRTEYIYPYTYNWSNVQSGTYIITVKATDVKGLSTTSAPVTITLTNATIIGQRPFEQEINMGQLSLKVSPDPVHNILQIYTKGLHQSKPVTISVISAAGVVMKTEHVNLHQVIQLEVSSLASAVYTLKIVSGDKVMYKQFVKL
ncbi:Ig-like domain-containing protein [Segetibacter koreensis]|uniref:Ig-like domain-containing protein n=1 Tax=Segetibacter koreensis TaxID=398037 RepID=UPI000364589A|nr:Ig-like domain-containing protein [Segetibacter koreensis]